MEKGVQALPQRIAILGPESSGKTTMANELAERLGYALVPEFARQYLSQQYSPEYSIEEVLFMAEMQFSSLKESPLPCIADTEMITYEIWFKDKFKLVADLIRDMTTQQQFDCYLLCAPDLPWEQDPLREDKDRRDEIYDDYLRVLDDRALPYEIIRGKGEARIDLALSHLRAHGLS